MNRIIEILMRRDGLSLAEARQRLSEAREEFNPLCDDPDDFLLDRFGLEPDYFLDFID